MDPIVISLIIDALLAVVPSVLKGIKSARDIKSPEQLQSLLNSAVEYANTKGNLIKNKLMNKLDGLMSTSAMTTSPTIKAMVNNEAAKLQQQISDVDKKIGEVVDKNLQAGKELVKNIGRSEIGRFFGTGKNEQSKIEKAASEIEKLGADIKNFKEERI